jgi:hypothetical protein
MKCANGESIECPCYTISRRKVAQPTPYIKSANRTCPIKKDSPYANPMHKSHVEKRHVGQSTRP